VHLLDDAPYESIRESNEAVPLAVAVLGPPVAPSKIVCVGRNYDAHLNEMGYAGGGGPSLFMKPSTALIGPGEDVVLPPERLTAQVEHEAELGVVIGTRARSVPPEDVMAHVLGFTCVNDVSARDVQRADAYPTRAKGFDTFCPVGPWVETDVHLLEGARISCRVNGETRQNGLVSDMIYKVPELIAYITDVMTLLPGDLVLTGSPGGAGPLAAGDQVEIGVSGVGVLRHGVVVPAVERLAHRDAP
jgi:2-keto-4-pentenoate hydratase/2-oxohepta-3-ene-1,7-dioic acid hydratase in catechol pathway